MMTSDLENRFKILLTGYFTNIISDDEIAEMVHLLNQHPWLYDTYKELSEVHAISMTYNISQSRTENFMKNIYSTSISQPKKRKIFNLKYAAVAAVAFLIGMLSVFYMNIDRTLITKSNLLSHEVVVPYGSQTKMQLPDGTKVWLNSGSKLSYTNDYGTKNRDVKLIGEAYFEVFKNKNIPFKLNAIDQIDVNVTGTSFNAKAYKDDNSIEIALLKGSVNIASKNSPKEKTFLKPNEKIQYNQNTKTITKHSIEASLYNQWIVGKENLNDLSLLEIFKIIERRYDVIFVIKTTLVSKEKFTGVIDLTNDINAVLKKIDVDNKYHFSIKDKTIEITHIK